MENKEEIRKEKFRKWFSNKNNLILISTIITAFLIRTYYFILTKSQTLWWDEAEYMSAVKFWGLGVPYDLNPQRPPLFQLIGAMLLKIGFSDLWVKFFLVVIPSTFLIFCIYLVGKELFNKKIGLIAATGSTFVWSLIFWSVRFQPDFFSLSFQLLSLFYFWKLFKKNKRKDAIYAGLFVALGFYFKISTLLIPLVIFIFVIYKDGLAFLGNKNYWISGIAFLIGMLPFMIWQGIFFGNPLEFGTTYSGDFNVGRSPGWMALDFFYQFPKFIFFTLFLAGLSLVLFNFILSFDILVKDKEKRLDPGIFSVIFLTVIALFYIFYIKGTIEDRWIFIIIPFIFYLAGITISIIYKKLKGYGKLLSLVFVLGIFTMLILTQIQHTDQLIKIKQHSYEPVKESALLIKEISLSHEKILSVSYTQTTAYSEREVLTYSKLSIENYTKLVEENKPSYLVVSILEPHHPTWMIHQTQSPEGTRGIIIPYFNSSIIINPQNQIISMDIKQVIEKEEATYTLIYPQNQFNGLFAYKISYR